MSIATPLETWRFDKPSAKYEADRPVSLQGSMADFLSHFLVPIAIGAVAIVLVLGLLNMMRGGSPNRSQQLMRLRVLLQAVAIVVALLALLALGH